MLAGFFKKTENSCGFFSPRGTQPAQLIAGPDATRVAKVALAWTAGEAHLSESEQGVKKDGNFASDEIQTWGLTMN
jgi:hypothetical protein